MRKLVLGIGLVIVTTLLVVLVIRVYVLKTFSGEYPAVLERYYYLNEAELSWAVNTIQPVVVGFVSSDERNYLLVLYRDGERWERRAVFVSGDLGGEVYGQIALTLANGETKIVTFNELRKEIKIGQQVRIDYLADYPEEGQPQSEPFCRDFYPICLYPALIENMAGDSKPLAYFQPSEYWAAVSLSQKLQQNVEPGGRQ